MNKFNFDQTLTNEEAERYTYISGDVKSAELFGAVVDLELNEEDLTDLKQQLWDTEGNLEDSNEECRQLAKFVNKLEDELEKYKACIEGLNNLYQVLPVKARELLNSLEK